MNAHISKDPTSPGLTPVLIQNVEVLRALANGPIAGAGPLADRAALPRKNIHRQLDLMVRDGAIANAAGEYSLTDTGRRALQALDLAAGRLTVAEDGAAAAPANDVLLVPHSEIRANPDNARKLDLDDPGQRLELDGLKSQIVSAGDVLQNLVVTTADAGGVRTLLAGERRWTAVGELIAEGLWPADRPLRAIERQPSAGEAAYISLVENSQAPLKTLERARAYKALCEEKGWSAREAALRTGWDVKSVQQYLQVLRDGDPDHIAAHEAGDPDWTWEALRKSVQKASEPEAVTKPAQVDVEDLIVNGVDLSFDDFYRSRQPEIYAACERLSPRHLMVVVEIADKLFRNPAPEAPKYTRISPHSYPDPMHAHDALMSIGAGGLDTSSGSYWKVGRVALRWLHDRGLLTATGDREAILARVRQATSPEKAALAAANDTYVTPWLDPDWVPEAKTSPLPPVHFGGGASQAKPPGPPRAAAAPDTALKPVDRVAMAELAHKLLTSPDGHDSAGDPTAFAPRYWLDQTSSDLKAMGLVVFMHQPSGPPIVGMPSAGKAWIAANFPTIDHAVLEAEREALPTSDLGSDGYATPWLNRQAAAPPTAPADCAAPSNDDLDEQEQMTAQLLLDDVRATLGRAHTGKEIRALLSRTGLERPFAGAVQEDVAGSLFDANRKETATCDVNGELPDAEAVARAELLAYALNLATQDSERAKTAEPALLSLRAGDLVHKGTDATAYRLLERVDDEPHQYGSRTKPRFKVQTVRNGKDYGPPVHISMDDIFGIVGEDR